MISQQVAEYVASVKYKTDLPSLRRARKFINALEKQMSRNTSRAVKQGVERNLLFNNRAIARKLNDAFNKAPIRIRINANNVSVDANSIRSKLANVIGRSGTLVNIDRFRVDVGALRRTLSAALNGEKMYRVGISPVLNQRGRTGQSRQVRRDSTLDRISRRIDGRRPSMSMALTGGAVTGGFGLMALNNQVRDWNMMETKFASITGDGNVAKDRMASLDRLGSLVGASPLELANQYTQMLATVQGTKLEPQFDQGFESFTKYGKVMGLDSEAMKGSFRAVTQMISKNQIMA